MGTYNPKGFFFQSFSYMFPYIASYTNSEAKELPLTSLHIPGFGVFKHIIRLYSTVQVPGYIRRVNSTFPCFGQSNLLQLISIQTVRDIQLYDLELFWYLSRYSVRSMKVD